MVQTFLAKLEAITRFGQLKYMAGKRTTEQVEEGKLCFHPENVCPKVMADYRHRLRQMGIDDKIE